MCRNADDQFFIEHNLHHQLLFNVSRFGKPVVVCGVIRRLLRIHLGLRLQKQLRGDVEKQRPDTD